MDMNKNRVGLGTFPHADVFSHISKGDAQTPDQVAQFLIELIEKDVTGQVFVIKKKHK